MFLKDLRCKGIESVQSAFVPGDEESGATGVSLHFIRHATKSKVRFVARVTGVGVHDHRGISFIALFQAQFAARDDQALNLACPFIDFSNFCIAEVSFDGQFFAVADTAMNLNCLMGHIHGRFGGE